MKGLSNKEIEVVSFLELNNRYFFAREDIRRFFKNNNELSAYLHRLKAKGRIIRLSRSKYYLLPIKAYNGHWSEHPFIIVDEIFNGKGYFIGGYAAAHYWGIIEQLPAATDVYCPSRSGTREFFHHKIIFKRTRKSSMKGFVRKRMKGHAFNVAAKRMAEEWLRSRQ